MTADRLVAALKWWLEDPNEVVDYNAWVDEGIAMARAALDSQAPAEGDEVLRLARVAVAESEGALMVCDWMEAALKVCRAVIAHPQPKGTEADTPAIWYAPRLRDVCTIDPGPGAPEYIRYEAATPSPAPAPEPAAWVPYLSDRADGVAGHYAIARHHPSGYREVWNLRKHCWGAFCDDVLTLEEANSLLRRLVIPTAPAARPVPSPAVGAEAGELRNYWADQMQKKADADSARGCLQPVSYYVWSAFIYAGVGQKMSAKGFTHPWGEADDSGEAPAARAGDEPQDIGGHIRAAANARVAQQADDDTRRLDYLQKKQATISLVPDGRDEKGTRHAFMVGGWHCSVNRDVRASIDAAMGESHVPVQPTGGGNV